MSEMIFLDSKDLSLNSNSFACDLQPIVRKLNV